MTQPAELETALATTEDHLDATLRTASALTRELKKAKAAAQQGTLRELRRALAQITAVAKDLTDQAETAGESFTLDEREYLGSGGYARELRQAAEAREVTMFESDERLLCYPSLIRVLPTDGAVEIDRRRERRLRPSVLVERLATAQNQPPRFKPEPFLAALAGAYDLRLTSEDTQPGAVVRLVDIFGVLTLLPGQDYSRPEFARDLYLLDQSGHHSTKDGRRLRFHASTGTKGSGTLTTVARGGQQQVYWGISLIGSR